ncbi:MAG: hypothetical protein VYD07_02120 [Pseudomonadota bacterium]|nr:hypothetical protein [Pseudomonadota bacterium]
MIRFIIVLIFLGSAVAQADSRYPHQCTGDFDVQVNQYNSVRFDDEILLPIKV